MLFEPIERTVFDKIREDNVVDFNNILIPSCTMFEFINCTDEGPLPFEITENDKDSAMILVHWIGSFI